jgi:hypothetical protein
MAGLEQLISWLSALISTGGLIYAPSALDPVANDLVAVDRETRQINSKAS